MNDSFRWWGIDRSSTLYSYGMTGAMAPYRYFTAGDNWRDALNQDFENFHKFWYGYFTATHASRGMLERRAANNPTYINTVENMKVFWDMAAWTAASELAVAANAARQGTMVLSKGFPSFARGATTTESSYLQTSRISGKTTSTIDNQVLNKGNKFFSRFNNNGGYDHMITQQSNGCTQFSVRVPGAKSGHTKWVKVIDKNGSTTRLYHDTYDTSGKILHRSIKHPGPNRHIYQDGNWKID